MTSLKERPTRLQVQAKWNSYVANRDRKTRDSLIEDYLPLLRSIASRVHTKLRGHVELDDLVASGALGLMAAVDSFDPSRGISFETFCTYRIRGAIFDEIRSMDWVPRLVRGRARQLAEAEQALSNQAGRKATDTELAKHLSVSHETMRNMRRDDRKAVLVSLSALMSGHGDGALSERELDAVSDNGSQDVSRQVLGAEFNELISSELSKAEQLILKMYYFESMTMAQIGHTLDLSESRISQMHTTILACLRASSSGRAHNRATSGVSAGPRLMGKSVPTISPRQRLVA